MRPREILLIKLGALGDVVRTTALLAPLRRRHAPCRVSWLASRAALPLLRGLPLARAGAVESPPRWLETVRFDLVVCLDEAPAAARAGMRARAARRAGVVLDAAGRTSYTPDFEPVFGMSLLGRDRARADARKRANRVGLLRLCARALGLAVPAGGLRPQLAVRARGPRGREVALHPGAGRRWPSKRLPEPVAAAILRRLSADGHSPVLVTGPGEARRNRRILARAGTGRLLGGLSLPALARRLARCRAVVSTDSLPMHLALAAGTPCVALFGPTSAAEIDPLPALAKLEPRRACRCFYRRACARSIPCLGEIDPDDVAALVRSLTRGARRGRRPRPAPGPRRRRGGPSPCRARACSARRRAPARASR